MFLSEVPRHWQLTACSDVDNKYIRREHTPLSDASLGIGLYSLDSFSQQTAGICSQYKSLITLRCFPSAFKLSIYLIRS